MSERRVEMTPERIARMVEIAEVGYAFRDRERLRYLAAKVLARALTDDSVWALVQAAATEPLPTEEPPPFRSTNGAP